MLPVDLASTFKALALTQEPLLTAETDPASSGPATPFAPGQKLQGQVTAEVSTGVFNVRIAGQLLQMRLPASISTGDTIALKVVSLQPRLTFSMVTSANPLSTPQQLSSAARLLSSLSQQQPEKAVVQAATNTTLWVSAGPPQSQQLADLLHEALGNSGLFYESHQAQWLGGARSTAQLLLEPQNQSQSQEGTRSTAQLLQQPQASELPGNTLAGNAPKTAASASTQPDMAAIPDSKLPGIPAHLQPLVQQQLNALETSHVVWQGQVWPGQDMQWEIHEQAPRTPSAESDRQWATQLHLELPKLGEVTARLSFNMAGVNLTLDAATTETRALLGSASSQLVAALSEAGIPVTSTLIAQHEPT